MFKMLYSHDHYIYTYTCRNIFNTIRTSDDTSLEKYTSHFIERVVCERKLETEQRLQHIDPHWLSQPFFSVLLGYSTGGLGAQPFWGYDSHSNIFSPTDLNFLSPGLYNNLTPTYFLRALLFCTQFNPSTVKVTPDLLIFLDWMHLLFTRVHFFFRQLGWVGGRYTTNIYIFCAVCLLIVSFVNSLIE